MKRALDFQTNGLAVNQERLSELYAHNQKVISELKMPINPNSYQQVRHWLGVEESDALARFIAAISIL